MTDDVTQERIRKVLLGVLKPLARTLLRCGVSYLEFSDLAKRAFVDAAFNDYGVRNRPTSIARVAVMTGLSRREISKIRRACQPTGEVIEDLPRRNLPAEVLHLWHTDPAFLTTAGTPRPLPFSGNRSVTFSKLVQIVTTDIPPRAMERELIRGGALRKTAGRALLPTDREYVPQSATEKLVEGLQYGLCRLVETISFNADPENADRSRFQRIVHISGVAETDVNLLRDGLAGILTTFGRQVDDYLTSFNRARAARNKKAHATYNVGIGLYYFDSTR